MATPNWNTLFDTAMSQQGLFTTQQAEESGYSAQLLAHHLHSKNVIRLRRGIYRLTRFPPGDHEELVMAWLWSDRMGVISHQTALTLHGLSDALPARIHLTLPHAWRSRRFRVPPDVVLHYSDVLAAERTWFGPVPTTNVQRTLNDCARASLAPDLLQQGASQALRRGLVARGELSDVEAALAPFGGLSS